MTDKALSLSMWQRTRVWGEERQVVGPIAPRKYSNCYGLYGYVVNDQSGRQFGSVVGGISHLRKPLMKRYKNVIDSPTLCYESRFGGSRRGSGRQSQCVLFCTMEKMIKKSKSRPLGSLKRRVSGSRMASHCPSNQSAPVLQIWRSK